MKKIILLSFFSILFLNSNAQTSVYHPFPDSNAVWNVYVWGFGGCFPYSPNALEESFSYIINGDTLIKSVSYHKLYIPFVKATDCALDTFGYAGFIRQDVGNKKVFFVSPMDSVEQLLFDFNLQVGDTIKGVLSYWSPTSKVNAIDSILIGGDYRKMWTIDSCNGINLIEGIGSTYGFIQPSPGCIIDAPYWPLTCFSQNGIPLYPNGTTSCAIVDFINNPSNNNLSIIISPNPSTNKFTISFSKAMSPPRRTSLKLFNVMGEEVYSQTVNPPKDGSAGADNRQETINTNLSSGIYFVRVSDNEKQYVQKIVVE